ncbi:MAG: PEGA domain-containing protein, partial [Myxococcota bacterium]
TLLKEASVRRLDAGIPVPAAASMLRPIGIAHATLIAVIAVFVLMSATQPPGGDAAAIPVDPSLSPAARRIVTPSPDGTPTAPVSDEPGLLRVVVSPWAVVYINGTRVKTTPFDKPIQLAPGSYRIGLRNPHFEPQDHLVDVKPGEVVEIQTALKPKLEAEP